MKNQIAVGTCGVVVFILWGCLSSPTESSDQGTGKTPVPSKVPTVNGSTYRNPSVGMELTVPSGWTVRMPVPPDTGATQALLDAWDRANGLGFSVIASFEGEMWDLDCDKVAVDVMQGIPLEWHVDVEPARTLHLDGVKACAVRMTGSTETVDTMTIDQVFLMHRNHMVLLTYRSPGRDTAQGVFAAIRQSLVLF